MSSGLDPKLLVPAVILYIPVMWALIHCDIAEDMRKGIAMAIVINALYVVFAWRRKSVPITRKEWESDFDRLDMDDDGFITRAEFTGSTETFKALDSDRDGRITRKEYNAGFDMLDATSKTHNKTLHIWDPSHFSVIVLCLFSPVHIPLAVLRQEKSFPLVAPHCAQELINPLNSLLFAVLQGYWVLMLSNMHVERESLQTAMHHELLAIEHNYTNMLQDLRKTAEEDVIQLIRSGNVTSHRRA